MENLENPKNGFCKKIHTKIIENTFMSKTWEEHYSKEKKRN